MRSRPALQKNAPCPQLPGHCQPERLLPGTDNRIKDIDLLPAQKTIMLFLNTAADNSFHLLFEDHLAEHFGRSISHKQGARLFKQLPVIANGNNRLACHIESGSNGVSRCSDENFHIDIFGNSSHCREPIGPAKIEENHTQLKRRSRKEMRNREYG